MNVMSAGFFQERDVCIELSLREADPVMVVPGMTGR